MRSTDSLFVAGFVVMAVFAGGACGDHDGTSGAGGSTQTTSTTGSPTTTGSTSGGGMGGEASGSSSSTGSGMGGMGGAGGVPGSYQSCADCTDGNFGAPKKECKAQFDACQKDAACTAIYNCSNAQCTLDGPGGCCSVKCWKDSGAAEFSWKLFKAHDDCVYCQTCKALCSEPQVAPIDATAYCANTANDGANCP
jgi:hypothetical protein